MVTGIGLCLMGASCAGSQPAPSTPQGSRIEAAFPEGERQISVRADEIDWVSCPPGLPPDCQMAVLEGNPREPMLFTARFRIAGGLELKPHWHPRNERVTILAGRVGVGFGDEIDRADVSWFEAGDYYVNAKGAHHFVLADGPAELQITGLGPWQVHYVGSVQ